MIKDKDFKIYSDENKFSEVDFEDIEDGVIRIFKIHGTIDDRDNIRTTLKMIAKKEFFEKRMNIINYGNYI